MSIKSPEALAKKALTLQARLSKQHSRLIAAANQIARTNGQSGLASSGFAAGAKFGASLFGRPKSSIRAKSNEGLTSFHFSVTAISRGSQFTELLSGRSPGKKAKDSSTKSESHQRYIERDDAVDYANSLFHQTYPAIDVSLIKDADLSINDRGFKSELKPHQPDYAAAAAAYIDRDGVVEQTASSFGNIAPTRDERIYFWRAVEEAERHPAKHKFTINPGIDDAFWNFTESAPDAPDMLKAIAKGSRDAIIVKDVKEKDASSIYAFFLDHRTTGPNEAQTLGVEPGRGGRVQNRMVIELPSDITPEQRLEIARTFCFKEFEEKNVRYHCAIHHPTKSNDERNFHIHITYYDRPTDKIIHPVTGESVWDFEVIERKRDGSRHYNDTRPLQQHKNREFQDYNWWRNARKNYAEIVNSIRKSNGMKPLYDPRTYKEMGIEVEAVPSLSRREFHDVQRGRDNPRAFAKMDKRWERFAINAIEKTPVAVPNKDLTTRYRALIQNVAKRAPASVAAAQIAHGAYLDAIRRINEARLDRVALKIAVEKEISGLIPEIGVAPPHAKKAIQEIEDLHKRLASPLYEQERLARESEQGAIQRLIMLEKQLKTMSLGSKSLPGYSFEQLAARAGLSATLVFPETSSNQISVAPAPSVAPKSSTTTAPVITPTKQPAEPGREAVAAKSPPTEASATTIKQPPEPMRTSPDPTPAPQAPVHSPTPIVITPTTPPRIEANPEPKRRFAPDIQTEAPVQPLPPIRMAPIFPRRAEPMRGTKTPLRPEPPKAPAPIKSEPKTPAPIPPKAPLQKAPPSPIRSTCAIKTPLPNSVAKPVVNEKSSNKSDQPIVAAPAKPIVPTAKTTQTPASPAICATGTALPSSTKVTPTTIPTSAPRSASNQPLPQPPTPAGKPSKNSPPAPAPKTSSSDTGAPPPTPASPLVSSVPSQISDEQTRKDKERREKRRAIFTTPRSRKPGDDYGR